MKIYKKPFAIFIVFLVVVVGALFAFRFASRSLTEEQKAVVNAITDFDSGNVDNAISGSEAMVSKDGTNIGALMILATSYAEKGNQVFDEKSYGQKAIETANKVLAIDPKNSQAYNVIGYAYEIMGKFDGARENYDKAIELDPKSAQAYSNKGHSYDLQGELDKASELYNKALSIDPQNEHALLNSARVAMRKNDNKSAEALLSTLVDTGKSARMKAAAYQLLSIIESKSDKGTLERAVSLLNNAIRLDPELPQAYTSLANLYIDHLPFAESDVAFKKDVSDAKAALNKALSINPNSAGAYYLLSNLARMEGDMKLSNEYREKGLSVLPDDITLGANEKEGLKELLGIVISDIKVGS